MKYVLCLLVILLGLSLHAQQPIDTTPPEDVTPVEAEPEEGAAGEQESETAPAGSDQEDDQADDTAESEQEEDAEKGFFESGAIGLLRDGGLFMWPLVLMAILAAGVIIERYRSLKMVNTSDVEVKARVQELLREDKIEEALDECESRQGPIPAVLCSGLRK